MLRIKLEEEQSSRRTGFTLLELIVVLALIGILIGMLIPARRQVREAARHASCQNNMKQIALATLNYESMHGSLPPAMGMPGWFTGSAGEHAERLSGLVHLLPYLEQQSLYDSISQPSEHNEIKYQAFAAAPWDQNFPTWKTQLPAFTCPSAITPTNDLGGTSYAFSIGDQARRIHDKGSMRGAFSMGEGNPLDAITDGVSNTIAFAEMGTSDHKERLVSGYIANQSDTFLDQPDRVVKEHPLSKQKKFLNPDVLALVGRGHNWADGAAGVSLVNTILAPNSPSFAVAGEIAADGVYSAGSFHDGGVQVAFADGHVDFIDEDIDAGNSSAPTPTVEQMTQAGFASPYGVWGALGTASGAEVVDDGW